MEITYSNTEQGETKGAAQVDGEHDESNMKPKILESLSSSLYESNNMNIDVFILEPENHKKEEIYIVDNEDFLAPEHDQSKYETEKPQLTERFSLSQL